MMIPSDVIMAGWESPELDELCLIARRRQQPQHATAMPTVLRSTESVGKSSEAQWLVPQHAAIRHHIAIFGSSVSREFDWLLSCWSIYDAQ